MSKANEGAMSGAQQREEEICSSTIQRGDERLHIKVHVMVAIRSTTFSKHSPWDFLRICIERLGRGVRVVRTGRLAGVLIQSFPVFIQFRGL
jgi:hypothetical protein